MQKWKKRKKNQIVLVNTACKVMFTLEFRNLPAEASLHFSLSLFLLFLYLVLNLITHFIVRKLFTKSQSNLYSWMNFQNRKQFKTRTWIRWIRTHMLKNIFQGKFSHWSWVMCVCLNVGTKKKRAEKKDLTINSIGDLSHIVNQFLLRS